VTQTADPPIARSGVKGHIDPTIAGSDGRARGFRRWAAKESIEDYSLRFAPTTFRKWTPLLVASTALGGIAYLADYAIGASIVLTNGAPSALIGILLAALVIFLTSVPIAYYSAKYAIDMDLLTRGAGFGYLGSTITSLIYASFTFIFFALEGSITRPTRTTTTTRRSPTAMRVSTPISYLEKFGYSGPQAYLLLGSAPIEGRVSGVVDIPNACCSLYLPTAIFDFDIKPSAAGPVTADRGSCAVSS
jgi:hypothetical protein